MSPEDLAEFEKCVGAMLAHGRVPNFAFWPERTILYVGFVENMRFPPRIEVAGPFAESALPAAREGALKAAAGAWEGD